MPEEIKKILVVSSYAPPAIGGPQMLYNLLRDFPADSYAVLTSFYNIDDISAVSGTWLPCQYFFYDNPGADKEARKAAVTGGPKKSVSGRIQKLKLLMKRIAPVRALAGLPVIAAQVLAIVRSGRKSAKRFQGEVLLGISDYGPAVLGSYILHKVTGRPLYLFMFDLYKGNFFPFPGGLLAALFEKKVLTAATAIIVTNEGTRDHYLKEYGKDFAEKIIIVHNSVFPSAYRLEPTPETKKGKTRAILFTGRVNWPQLGAIRNLVAAVDGMTEDIVFKLYSPMPREHLNGIGIHESAKVEFSFAPPEAMPRVQNEADMLFLPLSWRTQSQAIIDTATPGKLTDYLIAGRPILVHAPASSFLVHYAKENNFAAVVAEDNVESLRAAIRRLMSDEDYARQLVKNAKETFARNHDADKNAKLFADIFRRD